MFMPLPANQVVVALLLSEISSRCAMFKKHQMTAQELYLARSNEQQGYKDLDRKYYDHIRNILKNRTIEPELPRLKQKTKRSVRDVQDGSPNKNYQFNEDCQVFPQSPWISQTTSIIGTPAYASSSLKNPYQVKHSEFFTVVTSALRKMTRRWVASIVRCNKKRRSILSKVSKSPGKGPNTRSSAVPDSSALPVDSTQQAVSHKDIIAVDRLTSKLHRFKDELKRGRNRRRVSEEFLVDHDAEEHESAMHLRWLAHQHRTNPMLFARYGVKQSSAKEIDGHKPSSTSSDSWETDTSASSDSEEDDLIDSRKIQMREVEHRRIPAGYATTSLGNFGNQKNTQSKAFDSCPSISVTAAIEANQIEKSENPDNSEIVNNENGTTLKIRARSLCNVEDSHNIIKRVASCPVSQFRIIKTKLYEIDAATPAQPPSRPATDNEILYESHSSNSSVNSFDS